MGGGKPPGIPKTEPPTHSLSSILQFVPAGTPVMSSDLESTLEALQMNDLSSGTVFRTSHLNDWFYRLTQSSLSLL